MMQLLLPEILHGVNPKNVDLDHCSNDSPIGCFLEVDLNYPDKLLDLHNDYPLANAKIKVIEEMLSDD